MISRIDHFLGDNIRSLDWIIRRTNGKDIVESSPVGLLPNEGTINLQGLNIDWDKLVRVFYDYWTRDYWRNIEVAYEQLSDDLLQDIRTQIK